MNLLTHCKQIILPPLIVIVFGCFGLLPQARAQGGCTNFTTKAGCDALKSNTSGSGNTALGWRVLFSNTIGNFNTGVGAGALNVNDADSNTAVGAAALLLNTAGTLNTAVGTDALVFNDSGNFNTANGAFALFNSIGSQNTAIGNSALTLNTGDNNTAVGSSALASNTTGSGNIAMGVLAGSAVTDASSVIAIGADGDNVSNTTWIGNVFAVATQSGTTAPVIVSDTGQLGTVVSSERFKKDIATMDKSSETVLSLRPVTFHYKTDAKGTPQFGLIAEEVAKVNPALVLPDKEGKPYTVRYDAVNAMLLNEFLKEHRAVQDLKATVAEQQKQIEALTAGLQKVSAQLELSNPAPKTVRNDH